MILLLHVTEGGKAQVMFSLINVLKNTVVVPRGDSGEEQLTVVLNCARCRFLHLPSLEMPWHRHKDLPPHARPLILTWLGLQCYLQPHGWAGGDHAVGATGCPCEHRREARPGVSNDTLEWFVWLIMMEPLFPSFSETRYYGPNLPPTHTPLKFVC